VDQFDFVFLFFWVYFPGLLFREIKKSSARKKFNVKNNI
jgi:hypothetical protein